MIVRFHSVIRRAAAVVFAALAGVLVLSASAPALAAASPAGDTPEATVRAYYAALQNGACETAATLRPGYPQKSCKEVTAVNLQNVEPKDELADSAVVLLSVEVVKGEKRDLFTGFVGLKKGAAGWTIDGDTYHSRIDLPAFRTWLSKKPGFANRAASAQPAVAGAPVPAPAPPDMLAVSQPPIPQPSPEPVRQAVGGAVAAAPVAEEPMPALPPAELAPQPTSRPRDVPQPVALAGAVPSRDEMLDRLYSAASRNAGPLTFGSQRILDACWSSADLAYKGPSEKVAHKHGPDTRRGPPDRLRPQLPAPQLSAADRNSIRRVDTGGRKLVALTFDVCEQNDEKAGYDGQIVDYLRAHGIKATFYLGGKWMATHQERAMQIIADPLFEAGNHAWTHGNMRVLRGQEMQDQIDFTQAEYELTLGRLLGRSCARAAGGEEMSRIPLRLRTFRYPYGTCSPEAMQAVNAAGLAAVQWDVVTGDPGRGTSAEAIARTVETRVKPGSIVVMHANGRGWHTGQAVPVFIGALQRAGYQFVTVSELLRAGRPVAVAACYENKPGDNLRYDKLFGKGTGD